MSSQGSDDAAWNEFEIVVAAKGDSRYEVEFVRRVLRHVQGLSPHTLSAQHQIRSQDGALYVLDFAYVRGNGFKLAIEVDGLEKVAGVRETDAGRQAARSARDNDLQNLGWIVLHFTNDQMVNHSAECITRIERALRVERPEALISQSTTPVRVIEKHVPLVVERVVEHRIPVQLPQTQEIYSSQSTHDRRSASRRWVLTLIVGVIVAGIATAISISIGVVVAQSSGSAPLAGGVCPSRAAVKGNIASDGERIYHLPGSRYYENTVAEECFVSADAAELGGYRASRAG